jgi:3-oxoacyl-[acyl-carrier protein] reductase
MIRRAVDWYSSTARPDREEGVMTGSAQLVGRVALVTGGSRGIGKAVALAIAAAGGDVAVNCREREEEARSVADLIRGSGRRSLVVRADVSNAAAVEGMVRQITTQLGGVDVLVNNAGVALHRGLDELTEVDFDHTLAVNLKSAFLCTQAVLAHMRAQRWGRIVNISSGAARGAGGVGPHYNASKAGMEGLTRGYAARLVGEGITVNAVAPSLIDTAMVPSRAAAEGKIPLGRLGSVTEVAQAVLAVIGIPYMTGQTVALNGGMHFN